MIRGLTLAGVLVLGCAHTTTTVVSNEIPNAPNEPTAEDLARWRDAAELFARLNAEGEWDGEDCQAGLAAFERVNESARGRSARAVYMSGLVALRCANDDGARALFERALEIDPTLCEARVALGVRHVEAGRTAPARAAFEEAVRRDARCATGYVNLAAMQADAEGQEEAALANLRRALAVHSDYLPALNQMALIYLSMSDRDPALLRLAEVVCRQAQLIDEAYAPIYNTWGLIDVAQENITGAAAKFARAIELDPNLFAAHMNFGELTLSQRAYNDAARAFTRARELRPSSYDAAIGLGVALRGLRSPAEAERMYRAALSLDEARPEAWFDLAVLYHEHRDGTVEQLTEALELLRRFVESARRNADFPETVADSVRWCDEAPRGRRARACRPGRAQQIHQALVFQNARQASDRPAWTR
jgi:tetratricopeptide (TPR) repeat protein